MAFSAVNPVVVGGATQKAHYDRVFDNTLLLKTSISDDGDDWLGDVIAASSKQIGYSDGYFSRVGANSIKFWNGTTLGTLATGPLTATTGAFSSTLDVTGTATLGVVNASGVITLSSATANSLVQNGATTGSSYHSIINTGGQAWFGIDGSTGASFGTGNYAAVLHATGAGGVSLAARDAAGSVRFYANGLTLRGQINAGWQIGAPTGGDKGAGTMNFAADIYKNNTAYTNPDYVLEHWALGRIRRFRANDGADRYDGLKPLRKVEALTRKRLTLPRIDEARRAAGKKGLGAFGGGDAVLATLEEAYLYLFQHEARISALESTLKKRAA